MAVRRSLAAPLLCLVGLIFAALAFIGPLSAGGQPIADINTLAMDTNTPGPTPSPTPIPSFTPGYTMTIDSGALPNEFLVLPVTDNCQTNFVAFPGGFPCEMYQLTSNLVGQPLYIANISIPQPDFSIASGNPILGGVPDGTVVGAFGFNIGYKPGPCFPGAINVSYPLPTLPLVNAALPDFSSGPWTGVANGMPPQGPDVAGTPAVFNPTVWPTNLESDPVAFTLHASGVPLWARYYGLAPTGGLGTPVNQLVWNLGTSYLVQNITGDPTLPASPFFCSPYLTAADYLGQSPTDATPAGLLRQCNTAGVHTITADFIRADLLTHTYVTDTVNCSGPDTPSPSPTPIPTPSLSPSPSPTPTPTTRVPSTQSAFVSPTAAGLPDTGGMPSERGIPWEAVGVLGAGLSLLGLSIAAARRPRA
jgi:hypothetical protein